MSRPGIALLLLLLVAGCPKAQGDQDDGGSAAADDDDSAAEEVRATPVKVTAVTIGPIDQSIASSATVQAERQADIVIEVTGTVEDLVAEEGDKVRVGQVLARLKNPALKGELERAEASFQRSSEEFDSVKGLFEQGFVARNAYDEAAHAFDTARVTVEQAREGYASRELTSPIAGTISAREIRFGEAVNPPRRAFHVVDLEALRVEVNLPEKDLARLKVGQRAVVRSEVLDGIEAPGLLERISPVVDPATGTVKITVAIDPGDTPLRPGMFVNVDLVVDTHTEASLLPKRAVVYDEGEPLAFVVTDNIAKRTPLELGFADRDQVEVTGGLKPGDQVVIVGQSLLRDGAEVRIVE